MKYALESSDSHAGTSLKALKFFTPANASLERRNFFPIEMGKDSEENIYNKKEASLVGTYQHVNRNNLYDRSKHTQDSLWLLQGKEIQNLQAQHFQAHSKQVHLRKYEEACFNSVQEIDKRAGVPDPKKKLVQKQSSSSTVMTVTTTEALQEMKQVQNHINFVINEQPLGPNNQQQEKIKVNQHPSFKRARPLLPHIKNFNPIVEEALKKEKEEKRKSRSRRRQQQPSQLDFDRIQQPVIPHEVQTPGFNQKRPLGENYSIPLSQNEMQPSQRSRPGSTTCSNQSTQFFNQNSELQTDISTEEIKAAYRGNQRNLNRVQILMPPKVALSSRNCHRESLRTSPSKEQLQIGDEEEKVLKKSTMQNFYKRMSPMVGGGKATQMSEIVALEQKKFDQLKYLKDQLQIRQTIEVKPQMKRNQQISNSLDEIRLYSRNNASFQDQEKIQNKFTLSNKKPKRPNNSLVNQNKPSAIPYKISQNMSKKNSQISFPMISSPEKNQTAKQNQLLLQVQTRKHQESKSISIKESLQNQLKCQGHFLESVLEQKEGSQLKNLKNISSHKALLPMPKARKVNAKNEKNLMMHKTLNKYGSCSNLKQSQAEDQEEKMHNLTFGIMQK